MSNAAKTIIGFAIYMALTGLVLAVSPNILLGLLRLPLTQEPWIRLLGMFMVVVSYYYLQAARSESVAFFRASVHGRAFMGLFLVWLGFAFSEWVLLLFACGEWLGAGLTWKALPAP